MMDSGHIGFLEKSIILSKQAVANGDHPFGALLVREGKIILEALNTVNTETDATCHAELNLVSRAGKLFDRETLVGSTLYTSTEPCPMCAGAIYWAGVRRVVYACSTEKLGEIAGDELVLPCREIFARTREKVEVSGPFLEEEAAAVHRDFW